MPQNRKRAPNRVLEPRVVELHPIAPPSAARLEGALRARLGLLAAQQVAALGLTEVAEKVAESQPLAEADLLPLGDASLPLLGKLVELAGHRPPPVEPPPIERAIVCPLGGLLESRPLDVAIEEAGVVVAEQVDASGDEGPCLVVLDRWSGGGPRELLSALRRVLDGVAPHGRLVPLGPSSRQMRDWLEDGDARLSLAELLHGLRGAGVDTIAGGDDWEIHVAAAQAGFHVIVGQPLGHPPGDGHAVLCRRLIEARERLVPSGRFLAWQPELTMGLDAARLSAADATGLEALRAVALARLALPAQVAVRAPWGTFGAKSAHAALFFGASHWGLMAAGPLAAATLHLPSPDDLAELLEGNIRTSAENNG